jgi:hypothetical protein
MQRMMWVHAAHLLLSDKQQHQSATGSAPPTVRQLIRVLRLYFKLINSTCVQCRVHRLTAVYIALHTLTPVQLHAYAHAHTQPLHCNFLYNTVTGTASATSQLTSLDTAGRPPLFYACANAHTDCTLLLLKISRDSCHVADTGGGDT